MRHDFPMELITGIDKIDLQHMELVARIKMLHESYISGTSTEKILETFNYIRCYIDEHFKTEEDYMIKHNYPDIEKHKSAHKKFVEDYLKLESQLKQEGTSSNFNLDFNIQLIEWMKKHVEDEDIILADFIREVESNSQEETTK